LYEKDVNLLLVDIGEGLKYATHPELAVEGSWSRDEFFALNRFPPTGLPPTGM